MEATLRQSASVSSRLSQIDVSQLDKINAIPNKTTNNVLLDGLCQEDQLYLDALMDEESLDSGDDAPDHGSSPWSTPMAPSPMINSKRIKRMKPSYTITMSLEDISYIRPSWGVSKGVKRIELNKTKSKNKKRPDQTLEAAHGDTGDQQAGSKDKASLMTAYRGFLAALVLLLVSLMLISYFVDVRRYHARMFRFRLDFAPSGRSFRVIKVQDGLLVQHRSFKVDYGRGIPANLRHDECSCEMYAAETIKFSPEAIAAQSRLEADLEKADEGGSCFACYDWSHRANLQVLVNGSMLTDRLDTQTSRPAPVLLDAEDNSVTCYDVKWQSYDTLRTPLVDCFQINDGDQWFGLGDIQNSIWPVNKFEQAAPSVLASNLSGEFGPSVFERQPVVAGRSLSDVQAPPPDQAQKLADRLNFGSYARLQLLTASGFFVGNLRTDFRPSIKISADRREICLSVSCSERCGQTWPRWEDTQRFKYRNNHLEYTICSASSLKVLVSRLVAKSSRRPPAVDTTSPAATPQVPAPVDAASKRPSLSLVERQEQRGSIEAPSLAQTFQQAAGMAPKKQLDGLGLIERTIFVTSPEYIELLDGQTLRQHVDKIVKLNLKTSPILVVDARWQLYLGAFRISSALFPKAKLLFEILHNKGFKLVLTIKPYIDASIGVAGLSQLLDAGRIVASDYREPGRRLAGADNSHSNDNTIQHLDQSSAWTECAHVLRRHSFFGHSNETVLTTRRHRHSRQTPFLFRCKDSHEGHCVLIDLVSEQNRLWLIDLIKRSNFLAQEADGIFLAGTHPDPAEWEANFRNATGQLVDELFQREGLFVLPQWTGNFNYIQLAPRRRDWDGLRSSVSSVLTLSMLGFSLVHPGSVWGDLAGVAGPSLADSARPAAAAGATAPGPADQDEERRAEEELAIRWLQVAVFLPILQFNDLGPIERFGLHDQLQYLVKLRKQFVVPELKKYLPPTPLLPSLNHARPAGAFQLPALRLTWSNVHGPGGSTGGGVAGASSGAGFASGPHPDAHEAEAVGQQFMVGPDILVTPVLNAGQRQRDIYIPAGIWRDELRQTNVRGGKWLRNYPIELSEVAWFTRAKR